MKYSVPQKITEISRILRWNMTGAERILWKELRSKKMWVKFLRQHPIYVFTEDSWQFRFVIADFYCDEFKLIIELDGEVHNSLEVEALDSYKQLLLSRQWYNIVRFDNSEITDTLQKCIKNISIHCSSSP